MAQVRTAELAAQNVVIVLVLPVDLGSAIDGRARPAAAKPAAMSAPVALRVTGILRRRPAVGGSFVITAIYVARCGHSRVSGRVK